MVCASVVASVIALVVAGSIATHGHLFYWSYICCDLSVCVCVLDVPRPVELCGKVMYSVPKYARFLRNSIKKTRTKSKAKSNLKEREKNI